MEESIFDKVIDRLHERRNLIRQKLDQQYKRTKPFRMVAVPPKERLMDFAQLNDEDINFARQQFGDEEVNNYLSQMNELLRRYK